MKIGTTESSLLSVDFGVPQGSILGPLLLIIFINDLPNATKLFIKLFADDTFLCAQNSDIETLQMEVNSELSNVYQWLAANKLSLNIAKTKYMLVTNKNIKSFKPSITLNGTLLQECEQYKYLGVMIDKNLSWKPHIQYICKKISKACGSLANLRYCVGVNLLREVYHSLIHSYLRYGILAWGNASDTTLQPLKSLINRAVRIMLFAPFGRLDLDPIYDYLKILDVDKVKDLETSKFMYKLKNNILPVTIANYFQPVNHNSSTHSYSLRKREAVTSKISPRLASGKNSMQYQGEQLWSEIPQEIQACQSLIKFKRAMKSYLLKSYA